jgi:hypothetical protein
MSAKVSLARLVFALTLLVTGSGATLAQQEIVDLQYRRKVEMLYPLAKLIQPEQGLAHSSDTVVVGVLGQDPFQGIDSDGTAVNYLDQLVDSSNANRAKTKRKRLVVKRFDSAKDYTPCHILFVSSHASTTSEEKTIEERLRAALDKTAGTTVLIVADTEGLAAKGAAISFYLTRDEQGVPKVAFEFNPDAARRLGLTKIDAGIYRLARISRDP